MGDAAEEEKVKIVILAELHSDVRVRGIRQYLPAGVFVWKSSRGHGAWYGRYPPFKAVSRSWRKHGYTKALKLVISDAWRRYALLHGMKVEELDVEGLVDDATEG